jgi:hypothetical protein
MLSLSMKRQINRLLIIRHTSTKIMTTKYDNLTTAELKKKCFKSIHTNIISFTHPNNIVMRVEYLDRLNDDEKAKLRKQLINRYTCFNFLSSGLGTCSISLISLGLIDSSILMVVIGGGLYGLHITVNNNTASNYGLFVNEIDHIDYMTH